MRSSPGHAEDRGVVAAWDETVGGEARFKRTPGLASRDGMAAASLHAARLGAGVNHAAAKALRANREQ
jgi:hypothetical protein